MKAFRMLLTLAALAASLTALAVDVAGLPTVETSVAVRNQGNIRSFLRIPSPGFCYDNMKYAARVMTEERQTVFQISMLAPTNQPDRVVLPYARVMRPDFTEVDSGTFSNTVFYTNGQIIARRFTVPEKMTKYLIAVGYVNYRDDRHKHVSGGPYETIIDQTGKIVHRGEPKQKSEYVAKFSIDSDVIFLDDEIEVEVAQELQNKSGATNEVQTVFSYSVVNLDTAKVVIDKESVQRPVIKMKMIGNYAVNVRISRGNVIFWQKMKYFAVLPRLEKTFDPNYLGKLTLNDGVVCGASNDVHQFRDGRYSSTVKERITHRFYSTTITNIYGGLGRVINQDRGFFSYNLGVRVKRHMPYLLEIEYPEDCPRTFAVSVNGSTYSPCVQTGHTLPYQSPRFFAEQMVLPLNGAVNKMQFIVWAGDNEVRNGFNVAIADPGEINAPFSQKPLVLRISLYSFLTLAVPQSKERLPEQYQRYVWTEGEDMMAEDGVYFAPVLNSYFYGLNACSPLGLAWNSHAQSNGTVMFPTERYKTPLRYEIGGVEYDSPAVEESGLRENFIGGFADLARYMKLKVFPRMEYGGSDLMKGKAAIQKDGTPYAPYLYNTRSYPISDSVDVTYDGVAEDFIAVIEEMLGCVNEKSRANFRNLIIRQRANFLPISYSDNALAKYAREKGLSQTGEELRKEVTVNRDEDYRKWYQGQRYAFLARVNAAYNAKLGRSGDLLYYPWRSSGMPFEGLYFSSEAEWNDLKARRCVPVEGFPLPEITGDSLVSAVSRWTSDEEGFDQSAFSYPIVPVCPAFGTLAATCAPYHNLFRKTPDSLEMAIKVTPGTFGHTMALNADKRPVLAGQTMYRSREYSMYEAVMATIYANPRYLSFEQSHQACFPFAGVARRFFMNFLALPLVPYGEVAQPEGTMLSAYVGICENTPYVAVVNRNLKPVTARVSLPLAGLKNLKPLVGKAKRQDYFIKDDTIEVILTLDPLEIRSFKAE